MAVKTNYTSPSGKKYYRLSATIGKDSNGKLIRKYFYGKNKTEAEEKKNEYLNNIKNGLIKDYDKITLGVTCHIWLWEVMKIKIKPTTFERYESIYRNYIKTAEIYNFTLKDIKPIDMQRYYNRLSENGKSYELIKTINKVLKTFFNYCVNNGYILSNPLSGSKVVIPGTKIKKEVTIFDNEEIKMLINSEEKSMIKWIALTSLCTGMRRGEVIGLTWDNIDYKSKEITINKSVKTVCIFDKDENRSWTPQFQTPKTENSIRTIPLTDSFISILQEIYSFQQEQKAKYGNKYEDNNLIFCRNNGALINDKKLQRDWKFFCARNNIPYKKFHALRHTYATLQFENDVPLKTVSSLLGHSDIQMTANTYTHVLKKHKERAVDVLKLY